MRILFCCVLCVSVLTGCGSGFESHYKPVSFYDYGSPEFGPACPNPRVEALPLHVDFETIQKTQRAKGYVLIGQAKWKSTQHESDDSALEQAQHVGACLVLWSKADAGTVQSTQRVTEYIPARTMKVINNTKDGKEEKHIEIPAERIYKDVPVTYQQYEYIGLFFAKAQNMFDAFGIEGTAPSMESMAARDSRNGILVTAVQENSLAYHANIFPGDVILQMNDLDMKAKTPPPLKEKAQNTVVLERNGKKMVKTFVID